MTKWAVTLATSNRALPGRPSFGPRLNVGKSAIGRKAQEIAKGLADLMVAGAHLHRRNVGLHAFDVDGLVCLAAAYLEPDDDDFRYRYAVLCGGEGAKRALIPSGSRDRLSQRRANSCI